MENSNEMGKIMEEYKILKEKKDKMTKYKRDYQNIYYQQNTDKVKAIQKRYHDKVKNERSIKQKEYYQQNKDKIKEKARMKTQEKRKKEETQNEKKITSIIDTIKKKED
jgi:hypothetical protein